jgi:hypothetical protein
MLRSITAARRSNALLAAGAAALASQLFPGDVVRATTTPTITDAEVTPIAKFEWYDEDYPTYAYFHVEWDTSNQGTNTIYFYRGLSSTTPYSTNPFSNDLSSSGWQTCGSVYVDDGGSPPTYYLVDQSGDVGDQDFWWDGYPNNAPDNHGWPDVYVDPYSYELGVQAYDGSSFSGISWMGATENS